MLNYKGAEGLKQIRSCYFGGDYAEFTKIYFTLNFLVLEVTFPNRASLVLTR